MIFSVNGIKELLICDNHNFWKTKLFVLLVSVRLIQKYYAPQVRLVGFTQGLLMFNQLLDIATAV